MIFREFLINLLLIGFFITSPKSYADAKFNLIFEKQKWNSPILFLDAPPESTLGFIVIEQGGRIHCYNRTKQKWSLCLDINLRVNSHEDFSGGNEEGLLGAALHPQFPRVNFIYLYSSRKDPNRRTIISKFLVDTKSLVINAESEEILYSISQPYSNHNGGMLLFDQNKLYVGVGDGGSAGDPKNNAQNLSSPLGKILRFSLSSAGQLIADGAELGSLALKEIWAYGLRNPWRFSLSSDTKSLWVADVGQNKFEEIHNVQAGDNLGWKAFEAFEVFDISLSKATKSREPNMVYAHDEFGGISITGGYVYQGKKAELASHYIFGDYGSGRVWSISENLLKSGKRLTIREAKFIQKIPYLASFAKDNDGNIYAISRDENKIYILK